MSTPSDSIPTITGAAAPQKRINTLNTFIEKLDGQPSKRVTNLLWGAQSVPVDTIKELVALDVWPTIHRLIDNEAYTHIQNCTINIDGTGILVLGQRITPNTIRTITFDATEVVGDDTSLSNPPGKQISWPRTSQGGIDHIDDKWTQDRKPLEF